MRGGHQGECYICYGEGDEEEPRARRVPRGVGLAHVWCSAGRGPVDVTPIQAGRGGTRVAWRARVPWRRAVRTQVGVLEGREPAEGALVSVLMTQLGNGLSNAKHHEDALSVQEAELAMMRHLGAPEGHSVRAEQSRTRESLGQPARP